ncbi:MAG TPA: hypothetical protein VHE82_07465 [Gemmatimonadaceae bacterium]|nr:hypothetical protein [Gemmatimonadaceae bacterium]
MRLATFYRILTLVLTVASFSDVVGAQSPIGIFDGQTDVGRGRSSGSASYDAQRQGYLVAGSGQNMWNDRDDFHLYGSG